MSQPGGTPYSVYELWYTVYGVRCTVYSGPLAWYLAVRTSQAGHCAVSTGVQVLRRGRGLGSLGALCGGPGETWRSRATWARLGGPDAAHILSTIIPLITGSNYYGYIHGCCHAPSIYYVLSWCIASRPTSTKQPGRAGGGEWACYFIARHG